MSAALLAGALLAGCATDPGGSQSKAPLSSDVRALEGMRAQNLNGEMNRLGFTHVGGYQAEGAAITIWWRPRDEQCVKVETREGRAASMEALYAGNCR